MENNIKEKLLEWKASGLGLIDLRSTEMFEKFHVAGSTHIPSKEIPPLAHELPHKVSPLYFVGSEEELQEAAAYCTEHRHITQGTFVSTEEFWTQVKELGLFVENSHISRVLWRPTPCIEGVVDQIEALRLQDGLKSSGTIIDLACGAGRDMVFLAARGWTAIGFDYLEKIKVRALNLARRAGVTIDFRCINFEEEWRSIEEEFKEQADVVNVSRYLERDLMDFIKNLIRPGGFIVYHTFMEGCLKPKTKKYLLAPGELKAIFEQENQFEILEDKVIHLDDGRPTSYFLALFIERNTTVGYHERSDSSTAPFKRTDPLRTICFKQNQKPYRKYVFELVTGTGHRWEMGFRYSELQSLYDHIVKQFPKHKLSPFPSKVNPFKSEGLVIQERQTLFDSILKEMTAHPDICDCFQFQHFFKIKNHIYGDETKGLTQGVLWIKIIEAVGLELEENPKADISSQVKMRVSVPLNHSYHPPTLATQVFNNNKHAKWFEEFSVSLPNKEFPIQFKVWNHRTLASNQLLGRFELDIRPFASHQVHDLWLQISKSARLHVMFQFSERQLPSEPKQHINLKLPDLRLVLDRTTVYPGEMVTGGVIFNVGNPLSVKDITLKFLGTQYTRWKQDGLCGGNALDHNGHRVGDGHMLRRSEHAVLFNVDQILFAQQPVIDSGSYYWPFSFVMPLNLPPSMEHPFAAVTYTCSAHVNRPGLSLNKHVSNEIKVAVNYASAVPGPAVAVKEKKLNFRSKDQVINLSGKLEEGSIAEIGGQKLLSFTIENKSNYDVKSMRVRLESTLQIVANGFSRTFGSSYPLTVLNGREGMGLPVRAGRTLMGQIELKFPQKLLPTIFAQSSPLITVSHSLVMECAVSGFLTGSVSTNIPLVFNNNISPVLAKVQQPLVPQGSPMTVSVNFMPNAVTPMPPMDPVLFEQQYGVNYLSLNQMPDATPQFD